jgi:hypothetical protein
MRVTMRIVMGVLGEVLVRLWARWHVWQEGWSRRH